MVLTYGDLDGWMGGGLGAEATLRQANAQRQTGGRAAGLAATTQGSSTQQLSTAARPSGLPALAANLTGYHGHEGDDSHHHEGQHDHEDAYSSSLDGVAFIVYKNASHCTDTHTYAWQTPGEPAAWKQQRAEAMDHAVAFANRERSAALRGQDII